MVNVEHHTILIFFAVMCPHLLLFGEMNFFQKQNFFNFPFLQTFDLIFSFAVYFILVFSFFFSFL